VFWLGGIPHEGKVTGFSTNPRDPVYHITHGGPVTPPFYEFDANRLVIYSGNAKSVKGRSTFHLSYLDAFAAGDRSKPYAFFSSFKARNGYGNDCPTLGVEPYFMASGQFYNPNTFQIISAGQNQLFGPGGQWPPQNAAAISATTADDLANFWSAPLGVP
jgi:hypothetical protein